VTVIICPLPFCNTISSPFFYNLWHISATFKSRRYVHLYLCLLNSQCYLTTLWEYPIHLSKFLPLLHKIQISSWITSTLEIYIYILKYTYLKIMDLTEIRRPTCFMLPYLLFRIQVCLSMGIVDEVDMWNLYLFLGKWFSILYWDLFPIQGVLLPLIYCLICS
jgi:hypothetical protein